MEVRKTSKLAAEEGQLSLFTLDEDEANESVPVLDHAFRVVGDEVLAENLDPECWAKALAGGGRTKAAALSMYAKIRAEELAEDSNWKDAKAKALEERKITAAKVSSETSARVIWRRGFSLLWDFLFWQVLLSVSGVGLYLVILALSGVPQWWPGWLPVLVVSACLQVSPMILHGIGHVLFGRVRYQQALGLTAVLLIVVGGLFAVKTFQGKTIPIFSVFAQEEAQDATLLESSRDLGEEEF